MTTMPTNAKLKKIKFIAVFNRHGSNFSDLGVDPNLVQQVSVRWLLKLLSLDFRLTGFDHIYIYLTLAKGEDQRYIEVLEPLTARGFYADIDIRIPPFPTARQEIIQLLNDVHYCALRGAVEGHTEMTTVLERARSEITRFGETDEAQIVSIANERLTIQVMSMTTGDSGYGGKCFLVANEKGASQFRHFIGCYSSFYILRALFYKMKLSKGNLVVLPKKAWFDDRKISILPKYELPISQLTSADDSLSNFAASISEVLNPGEFGVNPV